LAAKLVVSIDECLEAACLESIDERQEIDSKGTPESGIIAETSLLFAETGARPEQ
jgi:hypothetical protein